MFGRPSLQFPVVLGELECRLNCLAAAGREEHPVEVAWRVSGQAIGEFDRVRVRVRPDRKEREFLGLLRGYLGQALAAVPSVDHEQAAQAVNVLLALTVPNVVAFALHNDGHTVAVLHDRLPGKVHPQVVFGLLLQVCFVVMSHGYLVPQL